MKTLKFEPKLCGLILRGEKTTTWRLFDEKTLINYETREVFGSGKITTLNIKTLGTLDESDWEGYEKFSSEDEMYKTYSRYSGEEVDADTELKIIHFTFTAR